MTAGRCVRVPDSPSGARTVRVPGHVVRIPDTPPRGMADPAPPLSGARWARNRFTGQIH